MDLKKIANTREMILALLFMVAFFSMFLRAFYLPRAAEIQKMKQRISAMQLEKDALEKFALALTSQDPVKLEAMEGPPNVKLVLLSGTKKPAQKSISELLETLAGSSFRQGIHIDSLHYTTPVVENGITKTSFVVNAGGSFARLITFVEKMDTLEALVSIDGISLNIEAMGGPLVTLELSGSFYTIEGPAEPVRPVEPVQIDKKGTT